MALHLVHACIVNGVIRGTLALMGPRLHLGMSGGWGHARGGLYWKTLPQDWKWSASAWHHVEANREKTLAGSTPLFQLQWVHNQDVAEMERN